MREIPGELIESARVDGAGHVQIFTRIMLPLMVPAIAAFGIFQFLWVWNDLLVALVFGGGSLEVSPLTVRLAELSGQRGQDWHLLSAGAFVSLVVPADRLPLAPALLRARPAGRKRQGVSSRRRRARRRRHLLGEPVVGRLRRPGLIARTSTCTRPNFLA